MDHLLQNYDQQVNALYNELSSATEQIEKTTAEQESLAKDLQRDKDCAIQLQADNSNLEAAINHLQVAIASKEATNGEVHKQVDEYKTIVEQIKAQGMERAQVFLAECAALNAAVCQELKEDGV